MVMAVKSYPLPKRFNFALAEKAYGNLRSFKAKIEAAHGAPVTSKKINMTLYDS